MALLARGIIRFCALPEGGDTCREVPHGLALSPYWCFPHPGFCCERGLWVNSVASFFLVPFKSPFFILRVWENTRAVSTQHPFTVCPWRGEEDWEVARWFLTYRERSPLGLQPHSPWLEVHIPMCVHQVSHRVLQLGRPSLCLYTVKISWALAWFSPTGRNISWVSWWWTDLPRRRNSLSTEQQVKQGHLCPTFPFSLQSHGFTSFKWLQVCSGGRVGMPSRSKTGRLRNNWSQTGFPSSIAPVLTLRPSMSSSGPKQTWKCF